MFDIFFTEKYLLCKVEIVNLYKIKNQIILTKNKMYRISILALAFVAVAFMTSCKSSESAYKKAYEKAQAQAAQNQQTTVTTTPATQNVQIAPVATQPQTQTVDVSNEPVRTESVNLISGPALKAYSVICGSFSLKTNAEGLQQTLKAKGYNPSVVYNPSIKFYRVAAVSYDDKSSAVQSRNQLRSTYPDAWLLLKGK